MRALRQTGVSAISDREPATCRWRVMAGRIQHHFRQLVLVGLLPVARNFFSAQGSLDPMVRLAPIVIATGTFFVAGFAVAADSPEQANATSTSATAPVTPKPRPTVAAANAPSPILATPSANAAKENASAPSRPRTVS